MNGNEVVYKILGDCYYNGDGVRKNKAIAEKWYRKKAEEGDAYAQYELGNRYFEGDNVPQNFEEALIWYRKSADQGNDDAQKSMGDCYFNGVG
ncbi:MAG: sel1 repeat family protein, partial [Thermoguttaceae bacterium]|nr:sel1 repeat family protein [Thermoguttaceae bacterium]